MSFGTKISKRSVTVDGWLLLLLVLNGYCYCYCFRYCDLFFVQTF